MPVKKKVPVKKCTKTIETRAIELQEEFRQQISAVKAAQARVRPKEYREEE